MDGDEVIVAPGDYGSPAAPRLRDLRGQHGPRPRSSGWAAAAHLQRFRRRFRRRTECDPARRRDPHTGAIDALTLAGLAERVLVDSLASPCYLAADGAVLRNSVRRGTQEGPGCLDDGHLRHAAGAGDGNAPERDRAIEVRRGHPRQRRQLRAAQPCFDERDRAGRAEGREGGDRGIARDEERECRPRPLQLLDYPAGGWRIGDGPRHECEPDLRPALPGWPAGDFHQLAGSPTIDAGINDPANGEFDFEWDARAQAGGTDIGADEFQPSPAPLAPVAPRSTRDPHTAGAFQPERAARRFAARRGSTIRYRLEAATVTFTVERVRRGCCNKAGRCAAPQDLPALHPLRAGAWKLHPRGSPRHEPPPLRWPPQRQAPKPRRLPPRRIRARRGGNRGSAVRAGMRIVRR